MVAGVNLFLSLFTLLRTNMNPMQSGMGEPMAYAP